MKNSEKLEKNSQKLEEKITKNTLGVDCISRDSALKALNYDIKAFEFKPGASKHMDDIAKLLNTIYEIQVNNIKALPSVTPQEPTQSPIIDWNNCHTYEQLDSIATTKDDSAVDCVSRQFMLDLGATCIATRNKNGDLIALGAIEHLPPVTPIRPKGHWIRVSKDKLRCSECDVIHFIAQYPAGKIDWCPNCGADMREVEE